MDENSFDIWLSVQVFNSLSATVVHSPPPEYYTEVFDLNNIYQSGALSFYIWVLHFAV